jgi:hypothetical protein
VPDEVRIARLAPTGKPGQWKHPRCFSARLARELVNAGLETIKGWHELTEEEKKTVTAQLSENSEQPEKVRRRCLSVR